MPGQALASTKKEGYYMRLSAAPRMTSMAATDWAQVCTATADGKFRAINKRTGKILWETDLPAPGVATPAVYAVNGRQYVVIACGGSKWGGKSTDAYVAFALPDDLRTQTHPSHR
jgi:glucose dehydrogenase